MRRFLVAGLLAIVGGYETPCRAQWGGCPGGVCAPAELSSRSTVRASVRSRSGPGGGGLFAGLGRALLGSRRGGGGSAGGYAYGAAYGGLWPSQASSAAPQVFGAAYAAPQTFAEGGSCYSSGGAAPMSYSPYAAPLPPPATYSTPQSFLEDEGYELVPIRRTPASVRPPRVRLASRAVVVRVLPTIVLRRERPATLLVERERPRAAKPERRPIAVAVRPAPVDPEQLADTRP